MSYYRSLPTEAELVKARALSRASHLQRRTTLGRQH
jgi:hypothetical protein